MKKDDSLLLKLARDSVTEVFQASRIINKEALLQEQPLLKQPIQVTLKFFLHDELKGSYTTDDSTSSLLENIILAAKKAAFEDDSTSVLTTAEYLHSTLEVTLHTPDGIMKERSEPIISD